MHKLEITIVEFFKNLWTDLQQDAGSVFYVINFQCENDVQWISILCLSYNKIVNCHTIVKLS